jgi:hypothetical protein
MTVQSCSLSPLSTSSVSVTSVKIVPVVPLFNDARSIGQNGNQLKVASVAQSVGELATVPLLISHLFI